MEGVVKHDLVAFYQGKRVFLTGGTGFKGAWLCLLLRVMGAEVYNFSLESPSEPALWQIAGIPSFVKHTHGDICDYEALSKALQISRADIVLHLAAQALVRPSYKKPLDTFQTNVMGTASLLEAVRHCESVKACIIVTSDKCYENIGKPYPYIESDRMGGYDPYSASKGCAELVVSAYQRSFFTDLNKGLASVRAGNVIGGGDFSVDRLIPDMVRAFISGKSVEIRYPHATRPWQHVLDPLWGYLVLAANLFREPHSFAGAWNFGPLHNEAHTVSEVVEYFSHCWGERASFSLAQGQQPHEAAFLGLGCHKAEKNLSWTPQLSFLKGLEWTALWYAQWHNKKAPLVLCEQQIQHYLDLACK